MIILEALARQGLIKTSPQHVQLHVGDNHGVLFVSCSRLPAQENNLFIQSLQEFLDPVENPRYLLVRHSKTFGAIRQSDYFAIPAALSANKKSVDIVKSLWEKYIGDCDILYTRSLEGRKTLLKARTAASSSLNRPRSKRLSKWQ